MYESSDGCQDNRIAAESISWDMNINMKSWDVKSSIHLRVNRQKLNQFSFMTSLIGVPSCPLGLKTTEPSIKLEPRTKGGRLSSFENITFGSENIDVLWERGLGFICLSASSGRAGKGMVGGARALGTVSLRAVRRDLEHIHENSNQQKQKEGQPTGGKWKSQHFHFAFWQKDFEKQR